MIYLDHNSTTNILENAKYEMISALQKPFNASAVHRFGREGKKIIEKARKQIASLLGINNCFRDYHITFTSSGTEANNLILSNFKEAHVFVSAIEHPSVLNHSRFIKDFHIIKVGNNGIVDEDNLKYQLSKTKDKQKLVSIIFAHNETGVIQNIKRIAQIAHEFGALIHSDCVQALGKISIDLIDLDIDFVTVSAHKIGGPVGAGALISKAKIHLIPHVIGGGQEKGLRSGTENVAAIAGFGAAAMIVREQQLSKYKSLKDLRDYLEKEIVQSFPHIKIANLESNRLPNTSLIINSNNKAETQVIAFDLKDIAISSGSSCSSGKVESSHSLLAMKFSDKEKNSAIRVSLGNMTTKKEVDKFLEIYKEING